MNARTVYAFLAFPGPGSGHGRLAVPGAYWRELGDEGHAAAAEDAARSCGGDPAAGADPSVSHEDGAQQDAASLDASGGEGPAAGDQGALGDPGSVGDAGHELASALPVDPGSTRPRLSRVTPPDGVHVAVCPS